MSKSHHNSLVGDALKAIRKVATDTSVNTSQTVESLEELQEEIKSRLDALVGEKDDLSDIE